MIVNCLHRVLALMAFICWRSVSNHTFLPSTIYAVFFWDDYLVLFHVVRFQFARTQLNFTCQQAKLSAIPLSTILFVEILDSISRQNNLKWLCRAGISCKIIFVMAHMQRHLSEYLLQRRRDVTGLQLSFGANVKAMNRAVRNSCEKLEAASFKWFLFNYLSALNT